jgi:hypothetical protein
LKQRKRVRQTSMTKSHSRLRYSVFGYGHHQSLFDCLWVRHCTTYMVCLFHLLCSLQNQPRIFALIWKRQIDGCEESNSTSTSSTKVPLPCIVYRTVMFLHLLPRIIVSSSVVNHFRIEERL